MKINLSEDILIKEIYKMIYKNRTLEFNIPCSIFAFLCDSVRKVMFCKKIKDIKILKVQSTTQDIS